MKTITNYFPDLDSDKIDKLARLKDLYFEWNEKINVISRKDTENFYERHVLHSLSIAKIIQFKPNTKILDVGTGGGFPGIPLAILFPETNFHLVDSIGKKILVVNEIQNALKLENVLAQQKRAEECNGSYDFVVNRAVSRMSNILPWVSKKISTTSFNDLKNGIISLKGGDLTEELEETKKKFKVWDISEFFEEEFFETKKVVHLTL